MKSVALTGSQGFLGWHARAALMEHGVNIVRVPVGREADPAFQAAAVSGTERVIHIAGVNRAEDDEVREGNLLFARQLAQAIRDSEAPPKVVAYANSTQAGQDSAYGEAKAMAADLLAAAAADVDAEFVDVRLPNLFGEHGRPYYNAVTATFCHLIAAGESPTVDVDKELTLLHAQDAADLLIGQRPLGAMGAVERRATVSDLLAYLNRIADTYRRGEIPDLSSAFGRDLFNTYRSHTFPAQAPVSLARHEDPRGVFFEIIRSHGGDGQHSYSTTVPGISRGDHFHRRKVERFTVVAGTAVISLRRLFTDDVVEFTVSGERPVAIDIPTLWSHKITNTGNELLYTSFWTNDCFDPSRPDTIQELV